MEKKIFSATLSFCHKHTEGMSDYSVSFNSSLEKSKKILMTFTGSCPVWMSSLLLEFLTFVFSCIFLQ